MTIKKIQEAIKKYNMELVIKDGQEMIKVNKPSKSAKINEGLKKAKADIVAELKRQDEERRAKWVEIDKENARKKSEYMNTADLRRCLVLEEDENYNRSYYVMNLDFVSKDNEVRAYRPNYGGLMDAKSLKHVTGTMNAMMKEAATEYGFFGAAWEITPEQEAQVTAEQAPAAEEAARIATAEKAAKAVAEAEKKAKSDAELNAKFDEARATGKPVLIRSYMVPCSSLHEECNVDNVVEYAMPDGTTKKEQHHTW